MDLVCICRSVCVKEREEGHEGERHEKENLCTDIHNTHPCVSRNWNNIQKDIKT